MKHKTLIENTFPLPLLLGYETSKPVPIAIATLLQRERVLTFHKCRKYREIGFWKPVLVAKFAENDPQMASKACLKDGKWTPQIPCPIGNHFSWGLGYFARQTKLKWTKNFKALFLSLTKYNGTVFWRFATDMFLIDWYPLGLLLQNQQLQPPIRQHDFQSGGISQYNNITSDVYKYGPRQWNHCFYCSD